MKCAVFLTQVLPYPLDAGPKLRAYFVLRWLAKRAQVTLISFVRPGDPPEALEHLRGICERVVTVAMPRSRVLDAAAFGRSLLCGEPFLITRDRVDAMSERLRELVQTERFDYVHADQLWMAPYAQLAREFSAQAPQPYRPRLVLDQHNAVFLIPQRMAANTGNPLVRAVLRREARLMKGYEVQTCTQFDQVTWVTQEDLQAVAGAAGSVWNGWGAQPVIPICIDTDEVQPVVQVGCEPGVLFVGGMHWPPNAEGVRWFVREVWPLVRAKLPKAVFYAVGKSPPEELRDVPGVVAPGYIEDVLPYWERSCAFVVPLKAGGGMRVKILDAWARRLPVISTSVGAEGLAYQDGLDILIADDARSFAEQVIRTMQDAELAQRVAQGGRETVQRTYDWRVAYEKWGSIYSE